jgi:hypothetical protein
MKKTAPQPIAGNSFLRLQQVGERALHEKRFEVAKDVFDKALTQASKDSKKDSLALIAILDLRVEAHLRLKDVGLALKDARAMIRHDRADPRGYLRCGQLCRLKNDCGTAQKWYEQGLKNVPQTKEGYEKLEAMWSKTIDKSAASQQKFRDPLVLLPMDLIHMLCEYIDFRQATSCLRVSKTWRNVLLAVPSLWKNFNLLGANKPIPIANVKACVRRLQNPPTTVKIGRITSATTTYLSRYVERWKSIEHLMTDTPDLLDFKRPCALPSALKSIYLGKQCPIHISVVDNLIHSYTMLHSAQFDCVIDGLTTVRPFLAEHGHWREHRRPFVPGLTHLGLVASEHEDPRLPRVYTSVSLNSL